MTYHYPSVMQASRSTEMDSITARSCRALCATLFLSLILLGLASCSGESDPSGETAKGEQARTGQQQSPVAEHRPASPPTAGKALTEPPTVGTAPPAAPAPTETVDEALQESTPTEEAPVDTADVPYQVVDGRIDQDTVEGWKVYRGIGTCATCHGPAGQGGVGSDLTDSLKERVDYELFRQIVANGKSGTMMKPFKTNQAVMDNLDKIYAYLKARADGVLGPGNLLKEPLGKGS